MPNVEEKITFGLELEGVTASPRSNDLALQHNFTKRYDHSIRYDDGSQMPNSLEAGGGFEFITPPYAVNVSMTNTGERLVLSQTTTTNVDGFIRPVSNIVQDLCRCISHSNGSCGIHVHLGKPSRPDSLFTSRWEPEKVRTMLAIGLMLESRIFEVVPSSRLANRHCAGIREKYSNNDLGQFYPTGAVAARKYENAKRYCWLNLIETRRAGDDPRPGRGSSLALGTVEVRALGDTTSSEYIEAWLWMWLKIAAYVAHLPTSLAILRCGLSQEFEADFDKLSKLRPTTSTTPNFLRPTDGDFAEPPTVISVSPPVVADQGQRLRRGIRRSPTFTS